MEFNKNKILYHIFCDESCHLENDYQKAMTLGAIWCQANKIKDITKNIKNIKLKYNIPKQTEIKWTKVSPAQIQFYSELIDYFFSETELHFRVLVIPDKLKINHKKFNQSHDDWYYKMYFNLLKVILSPDNEYKIFLDIKDTKGGKKIKKLHEVLCTDKYDFSQDIIKNIKLIRSHDSDIMGLTDLLIGAVSYKNRKIETSFSKISLIKKIIEKSHYSLNKSTLFKEDKFNIFIWRADE